MAGAPLLNGCSPASVGSNVGIAAFQERTAEDMAYDLKLKMKIAAKWLDHDPKLLLEADSLVYEGRALLTGNVDSEERMADIVRLTWEVEGVKEVLNEILVAKDSTIMDKTRDAWISAQLGAKLTMDKKVYAINYASKTVGKGVYLIGIAQSKEELDRVIAHARNIDYVRSVTSHVRVKSAKSAIKNTA